MPALVIDEKAPATKHCESAYTSRMRVVRAWHRIRLADVLGHAGALRGSPAGPTRLLLIPLALCGPLVLHTRYPLTSW